MPHRPCRGQGPGSSRYEPAVGTADGASRPPAGVSVAVLGRTQVFQARPRPHPPVQARIDPPPQIVRAGHGRSPDMSGRAATQHLKRGTRITKLPVAARSLASGQPRSPEPPSAALH